jgi:hypothetical protein
MIFIIISVVASVFSKYNILNTIITHEQWMGDYHLKGHLNGSTYGGNTFNLVGLPNIGQNLTPDMHHMVVARQSWVTGLTGTVFFSFVLEAASTDRTATHNYLVLEKGHGGIQVAVFKS